MFFFSHPFGYICFFWAFIHFKIQHVGKRGEFLQSESICTVMSWRFPIRYFLRVVQSESRCISVSGPSSNPFDSFSLSAFLLYFCAPTFYSIIFLFSLYPVILLLVPLLLLHLSKIFFRNFSTSCLLYPVSASFKFSLFRQ